MTIDTQKLSETLDKAIGRAYNLGQTYWMQADSESYSQNRRADETQAKFDALRAGTVEEMSSAFDAQEAEVERLRGLLSGVLVDDLVPLLPDEYIAAVRAALSGEGKC